MEFENLWLNENAEIEVPGAQCPLLKRKLEIRSIRN